MREKLIINGVTFHAWAQEEGISVYPIRRQEREIIYRDGTKEYASIDKHGIDFSAIKLSDTALHTLRAALSVNPASVTYSNRTTGADASGTFYIYESGEVASKVIGNTTFYTGFALTLEEK